MAWPPASIASDKSNATVMVDDHALHHNTIADAINDTVTEILNGVTASRSLIREIKNVSGGTLVRGDVVRVNGAVGENITVTKAQAGINVPNPPNNNVVFGIIASASISDNANGDIIINGVLKDLNTNAWNVGDFLYLSATTAGALTSTPPAAPNEIVCLALVTKKDATEGQICMQVQQPVHLNTVVGFNVGILADNDVLAWDASSGTFVNYVLPSASTLAADAAFTGAFAPLLLAETTTRTANYTLALTDQGLVVPMNGTTLELTVPTNSSVAFPVGSVVNVYNLNVSPVEIKGAGGVTVRNAGFLAEFGEVSLRKRGTDEWVVAGNLS
jgi:hypothetical protein